MSASSRLISRAPQLNSASGGYTNLLGGQLINESLEVELAPRSEDLRVIQEGLRAFTDAQAGPVNARPLAIFIRNAEGAVVGGLDGELRWTWLFVAHFWLAESLRGRGVGTALLARAESFAREQGATAVYLDTLDFQALSFYQRRGYSIYGVLDGFPPGFRRFYLQKRIAEPIVAAISG
jgi:GNAT superfamily N-acetyltransferase